MADMKRRGRKVEGLDDNWQNFGNALKKAFANRGTVGDRLQKRRDAYDSTWDKITSRRPR